MEKPKNVAELKRFLEIGTTIKLIKRGSTPIEPEKQFRVVSRIQSKNVAFRMDDGRESWLEWPRSGLVQFSDTGFIVNNLLFYEYVEDHHVSETESTEASTQG